MKKYVLSLTTFVEIAIGTAAYIAIGAMPSVYSAKNWDVFPYFRIIILTCALLLIYFIEKKRGNDLKIVLPLFFGAVFVYLIFLYVKGYYPRNTFVNGLLWQLDSFYSNLLMVMVVAARISDIIKESRKSPVALIISMYITLEVLYATSKIDYYARLNKPHANFFVILTEFAAVFLAECFLVYYPYFAAKKNFLKGFSESAKFFHRHFVFTSAIVIVADILMLFSFLYGKGLNERFVVAGNNTALAHLNAFWDAAAFLLVTYLLVFAFSLCTLKAKKEEEVETAELSRNLQS